MVTCGTNYSSLWNVPSSSTNTSSRMPIRPHSQSSPLPHQTPQQQISPRRGSEPPLRTVASTSLGIPASTAQANDHGRGSIVRHPVATRPSITNGARSMQRPGLDPLQRRKPLPSAQTPGVIRSPLRMPPYPLTPPSTPRPTHLSQHGAFPTPWYQAPTPPPQLPTIDPTHTTRPERPPLTWKHCLSRLDNSLKKLSIVTSLWLLSFVISLCIFIRSLTSGTPHIPASRTALLIWFCVSAAGLSIFFSLVLGVLCRRARRTSLPRSENHRVRSDDIEMQNFTESVAYGFAMGICSRDLLGRRNAISGPSERQHHSSSGIRQSGVRQRTPVWAKERIIRRANALPVRVSSAQVLLTASNHAVPLPCPRPLPVPPRRSSKRLQPKEPLIVSSSGKTCDRTLPTTTRSLFSKLQTSEDKSRREAYSALARMNSNISPKTKSKPRPDSPRPRDAFQFPSPTFDIHARTKYPSSTTAERGSSPRSIKTNLGVYRDDADTQSMVSNHESIKDNQIRTASAMSLRSAGKAKECFVRASPGASTMLSTGSARVIESEPQMSEHEQRRASSPTINLPQTLAQEQPGMPMPMPLTSKLVAINRNISSQALSGTRAQKSRETSLKKVPRTPRTDRARLVGLGISVADEDKENLAPGIPIRRSGESDEEDAWMPVLPFESA